MKKVLLLSLGLVMGFSAFAQNRVVKADKSAKATAVKKAVGNDISNTTSVLDYSSQSRQSVVTNRWANFEESETMWTYYDLQSNFQVSNRMYQHNNGSVAITATMSHESNQTVSDRGTGYNFAPNGEMAFGGMPEVREEANATGDDLRTGWPTIAPYGATGEILVNHASGLNYWTREVAGEGQWDGPFSIPNPQGLDGQQYDFSLSWPRVATSGANNEIVHVFSAAQYNVSANEIVNAMFYSRFDGETWSTQWAPLFDTEEHMGIYSADDYSVASNGDVVAVVYSTVFHGHVVMYKSTDNGLTWERNIVWENPYYGCDWETDECSLTGEDPCYSPVHNTVAVGPDGVVHVAVSTFPYTHTELGTMFSYYYGRVSEGIAYWNDTKDGPITSADGNPKNALKLWVDDPENEGYLLHSMDSINFCGWIPFYENIGEFNADMVYKGDDYIYAMYTTGSAFPALSVDSKGNLALAYSTPDTYRTYNGQYYYRSVAMSYKDADSEGWNVAVETVMDDFIHMMDEAIFVNAAPYATNEKEFWFSYIADATPGLFWGSTPTQTSATSNTVYAFKITPGEVGVNENIVAKDVVYNIFPNPATDFVNISSSMEADATITFTNLAGQTVKVVNQRLTTGDTSININDLTSGVYFCTVNANGYNHTSKVVVK